VSAEMGEDRKAFIDGSEKAVTFLLLLEIIIRFLVDWRDFFHHKHNNVDLALAVITTILQIPAIHDSGQIYVWLSVFQIMRIYRVVMAISLTRDLIVSFCNCVVLQQAYIRTANRPAKRLRSAELNSLRVSVNLPGRDLRFADVSWRDPALR